jgi:teichuronic acid biosynthesis glycosyltransferase TuaG
MTYDGSMAYPQTQIGRVDVIVPTYQETERLDRALASAMTQGSSVSRIHVLDDGSDKDVCRVLLGRYSASKGVVLSLLEHTGMPGSLRNLGLFASDTEWVAFLDADDYWQPAKLSRQLDFAKKHNLDLVFTNATEVSLPGGDTKAYFPESKLKNPVELSNLLKENLIVNSSVIVKREVLISVGGVAHSRFVHGAEDYATWLRVASVGRIGVINEQLVVYEKTTNSFSRQKKRMPQVRGLVDFLIWTFSHEDSASNAKVKRLRWAILGSIIRVSLVEPLKSRTYSLRRSN